MENRTISLTAVIAVVIAIISLIISWSAYNRVGADLRTEIERQASEIRQDIGRGLVLAESRARLAGIEARVAAGEGYEEARREVGEIRGMLRNAFSDAGGELQQDWQGFDENLGQLEESLRTGSADAVERLREALGALERGLRGN